MLLPAARKDRLVRATDIDALSCKVWANTRGYFVEKDCFLAPLVDSYTAHLRHCEGYTAHSAERTLRTALDVAKFPLINRGTFLRTHAIDVVTEQFIQEHNVCLIVSLGGGSDTRAFRMLSKHPQINYVEVDFPESAKIKKLAIFDLPQLRLVVGYSPAAPDDSDVSSKEDLERMSLDLYTDRYTLLGFDLRHSEAQGAEKFLFLDKNIPTLVISECVLCYLTPEGFRGVLRFWRSFLPRLSCVLFDPMSLGDGFGEAMTSNLNNRGIDLQTFREYPTLAARKSLLEAELGFRAFLTDMAAVGGFAGAGKTLSWLNAAENMRISRLEMMDEIEEIALMLRHYSLIFAESNILLSLSDNLPWILK